MCYVVQIVDAHLQQQLHDAMAALVQAEAEAAANAAAAAAAQSEATAAVSLCLCCKECLFQKR